MSKPKKTTAEVWKKRYAIASENQSRMFKKGAYWFDLMYAHINTSNYAMWRSKIFLPILSNKAWSMVAKLTSLNPGFEVGVYGEALNDPEASKSADKAQWKLEHDWNNPRFDEPMRDKLFSPLLDAVVIGTGFGKVPWCLEKEVRYEHAEDEMAEGEFDYTHDVKTERDEGYNDLIPQDFMSTFIAPGATSVQKAAWIILEDFATYDTLQATNDASGFEFYKNLDKVKALKATNDANAVYKKSRERLTSEQDNVAADTTLAQFRRYECYEKSTGLIYTFAAGQSASGNSDEWIELNSRPNPYWHGKYPLVAFYIKRRPLSVWGQGIFEDTERLASAANDIVNHYMDNLNISLDGMIMKPETETYEYVVQPGGEFLYKEKPPEQFKFPEPNPTQLNTMMELLNGIVEDATISSYAEGSPQSATDKTQGTASGIAALQNAAGDKIGFMKQNFATALKEVGVMWLSNNQQYMVSPTTLMGQEDGRPVPITITPQDLQAPMLLRINDASMEPENKAQRAADFANYLTQITALVDRSFAQAQQTRFATEPVYLNYASLIQDVSQNMGQVNYEKILLSGDEVNQAMQNSQTPMVMPNERLTITPADMLPSEVAQLLQRNGIKPDPGREQGATSPAEQVMLADATATLAKAGTPQLPPVDPGLIQDAAHLEAQGHVPPGTAQQLQMPQPAMSPQDQAPQPSQQPPAFMR